MIWNELSETLAGLAGSIVPPSGTGLVVTEAEFRVPLEIRTAIREGRLVILAQPPHTRWKSGFLPATHMSQVRIGAEAGHGE
jgi:hypothetical protein